ncbi:hypothetical protein [Leptospira noguchii]|uniref:hypothetical protein n=1 Tax=Leptospira noguchii TaxID=28182 RepID=UPI00077408E1|nr:hypothetical protein [Leptospira noguchii]
MEFNKNDLFNELLEILPMGKYKALKRIEVKNGMMVKRKTVFAKAQFIKENGIQVLLKCIWPAPEYSGNETKLLMNEDRLSRIEKTLSRIKKGGYRIPLVEIKEVEILQPNNVLLIGMELLEPLEDYIMNEHGGDEDVSNLLKSFPVSLTDMNWIHFDICVNNVGISKAKKFYLIDPDSVYLGEGDQLKVSVPAFKYFNLPSEINSKIKKSDNFEFSKTFLFNKLKWEVCLIALQLHLGKLPEVHYVDSSDEWLSDWISNSFSDRNEFKNFWLRVFNVNYLENTSLQSIAEQFEKLKNSLKTEIVHNSENENNTIAVAKKYETSLDKEIYLKEYAGRLRAGTLDYEEMVEYFNRIVKHIEDGNNSEIYWSELLTISICFLKNAELSEMYALKALEQFPDSIRFKENIRMIRIWKELDSR